jgi:hypothetical protein
MDVEQLHVVLQQSFSPDANVRKPAEKAIRALKHLPTSTILLIQVAAEKQVPYFVFSTSCPIINIHQISNSHLLHFAQKQKKSKYVRFVLKFDKPLRFN